MDGPAHAPKGNYEEDGIVVTPCQKPLNKSTASGFIGHIDFNAESSSFGIDIYEKALDKQLLSR